MDRLSWGPFTLWWKNRLGAVGEAREGEGGEARWRWWAAVAATDRRTRVCGGDREMWDSYARPPNGLGAAPASVARWRVSMRTRSGRLSAGAPLPLKRPLRGRDCNTR